MAEETDYCCTNFISLDKGKMGRLALASDVSEIEMPMGRAQKDEKKFWSTQQLFAGALNACLMNAFLDIAADRGMIIKDYVATAMIKLEETETVLPPISEILIKPSVTLATDEDRDAAEKVLREAKQLSPVLQSITIPLVVKPEWAVLPGA